MSRTVKRGDTVRINERSKRDWDVAQYHGQVAKVITHPQRYCLDYHKAHYETLCTIELSNGKRIEIAVKCLSPADAIDQLAFIGRLA